MWQCNSSRIRHVSVYVRVRRIGGLELQAGTRVCSHTSRSDWYDYRLSGLLSGVFKGGALARAPLWPDQRNFGTESVIFAFNLAPKPSKFMYISKNRSVSGGLRPPYLLSGLCPWTPLGPSPRPPGWAPPLWPILNTPLGLLCFINVNTYKVRQDPLDTIALGTVVLSR